MIKNPDMSKIQIIKNMGIHIPLIKKVGENQFKTTLEDGFSFTDNMIATFLSLQALDCVFDAEKFLSENSTEVPFNEFIRTLKKKNWLTAAAPNGEKIFYSGQKRYTCKPEDKQCKNKIIQIICERMKNDGKPRDLIEKTRKQLEM